MGLGTLFARTGTILANYFDDFRAAWANDFVGRDENGVPAAGNNLGTPTYPWGTVYAGGVVLNGVNLSTTVLESPSHKIVSGKTRSGSNQPAFLAPAGSSLNFTVLASSVNLSLSIAGVPALWIADAVKAGTAAPSSQNTATVNDATAAAQAATRTWGEYGSGSPYYAITIASAGTGITNRVGTLQAFKIGTEYFIADVVSSTSLSRAFRGFFFDSAGAPIKRVTFSNSATITLMNLGWVFLDSDLTTVDVIFTGAGVNNAPTVDGVAPASPLDGDYWYDTVNSVWKKYISSVWTTVNRIPVGLVVCDATNCVAARSFDFFGLCRNDNTIELERISNTVIKGAGLFSRVNVNGRRTQFINRPTWDTALHLAAATERYNAAVTLSTTEYFYVTDDGKTKISDMEPYWRPDLLGCYHPFNPWRCVGQDTPDGSANFQAATLFNISGGQASIPRKMLPYVGEQISSSSGSFFTASTTYVDVTNLSVTISTTGRPVLIMLVSDGTDQASGSIQGLGSDTANATIRMRILRDSTTSLGAIIARTGTTGSGTYYPPPPPWFDHQPAGTYNYKAQLATPGGAANCYAYNMKLVAFEL